MVMRWLTLCALLAASVTVSKAAPPPPDVAALGDDELKSAYNAAARQALATESCTAIPYVDEVEKRALYPALAGVSAVIRAGCARSRGDAPGVLRELENAERAGIPSLGLRGQAYLDQLAMACAAVARDGAVFERHMDHIVRRDQPAEFAVIPVQMFGYGLNLATPDQEARVALGFARAKSFTSLDPEIQQAIAGRALKPAIAGKDDALVRKMLGTLTDSRSMLAMLTDRTYEAIWPAIGERVGPHASAIRAEEIRSLKALAAVNSSETVRKKALLMDALNQDEQFEEAIAVAQAVEHSPAGFAALAEDQAWLINAEIHALDGLGKYDEAGALADRLVREPKNSRNWMVSFGINRIGRYITYGQWARGLPEADAVVELSRTNGSPYAQVTARSLRACANFKTKRPFAADRDSVYADWQKAVGSAIELSQCLGDDAASVRFIRSGLEREESRATVISLLQPAKADPAVKGVPPRVFLDKDPALRALYERYGRDLPEEFRAKT